MAALSTSKSNNLNGSGRQSNYSQTLLSRRCNHNQSTSSIVDEEEDQSSLDLSLCLRGGSTDSRESFYMDLDKGIDSDIDGPIDQCDCICTSDEGVGASTKEVQLVTDKTKYKNKDIWVGFMSHSNQADEELAIPQSSLYTATALAPELSRNSANGIFPNGRAGVSLITDENAITKAEDEIMIKPSSKGKGRYHKYHRKSSRTSEDDDDVFTKRRRSNPFIEKLKNGDSVIRVLSAIYAKLLVVMGISFPLSEVISPYVPPSFFVGFYLYLYTGSIVFLIYAYSFLLKKEKDEQENDSHGDELKYRKSRFGNNFLRKMSLVTGIELGKGTRGNVDSVGNAPDDDDSHHTHIKKRRFHEAPVHCGSFFLRMGALAFGIGSMIYCGLEFGQFFEVKPNSECYNILMAVTPCTQMAFTFIQLYFIFMNSKMCIDRFKNIARFGLMHMVATNLCVWLYVLVQESKHEILKFVDPSHGGGSEGHGTSDHGKQIGDSHGLFFTATTAAAPLLNFTHNDPVKREVLNRVARGLRHAAMGFQCRRVNIMGQLVQDVSPFLFPCAIEYSLISAAILYVMWKNIGKHSHARHNSSVSSELSAQVSSRRHHYSVDCARANKGLFTGILILVLAIISLILFFVLINKPEYKELAVLEAHIVELVLYVLNTGVAIIALIQVRELKYSEHRHVELDNILLIVAQTGVYMFSIFCIIGGHFTITRNTVLVLLTALANLVQATVQTIFILDASRRYASTSDQVHRKPGREMITFLLVCNFAAWAIASLETRRSDSNPVQLNFYGFWAWTIIAHISTPLAIFFRFHSTVCLCEIWKNLYKLKPEHV